MTENTTKIRNCSIDIFRYICAIMVVAIHTHPFSDINENLGYIFTEIIPRIGVPFFFATSGYFYIQKLENNQKPFFSYCKRLFITYFIWSCIYFVIDFLQWGYSNPKSFLSRCIYHFIITGSWEHFWFFPALIFSVCLSTIIFRIRCSKIIIPLSIFLYIIGCLGCSYYEISIHIPVLENLFSFSHFNLIRRILLMGFPFFVSGYLVYKIREPTFHILTNKVLLFIEIVVIIIWLAEIYLVRILKWQNNIIITFGLYLLVVFTLLILLRNPLPQYRTLSCKSRILANFTYYSHPLYIMGLNILADKLLHMNLTATPIFLLTTGLTFICGISIYRYNNKVLNYIVN